MSFVFSQKELSKNYEYKVSKPYKAFEAKSKYYFTKNQISFIVNIDGRKCLIQKFDNTKPSFVKEKLYEDYFSKNYLVESISEFANKFYVFYSSWDGDNKKEQLFAAEIDPEKCEFVGQPKLVFQINGKVTIKFDEITLSAIGRKFDIYSSFDKTKLLVQFRRIPEKKRDVISYDIIGLKALNADLSVKSENEVTMPYTERQMNNLDYQVDNEGNFFMLTKVFHDESNKDKKSKKDEVANYHLEVFYIKSGTNDLKISKLDNKDKFINQLWIFDSPKDYLVCGGFYTNGKGDENDADGVFSFKIDKNGGIYGYNFHDIPLELINQYEDEKTIRKNDKKEKNGKGAKFTDLYLNQLIVNNDGSIVLIGEQWLVDDKITGAGNSSYDYYYLDILAAKIGADGQLNWMKKIPKEQVGKRGIGGMSYAYLNTKESYSLIFLDNIKNIDLPLDKKPAKHSDGHGGYLTAVKISDKDGSLTKDSILNGRDVEDFEMKNFFVEKVFKLNGSSFLLEVSKKKKEDVMIKVEMK